MQQTSNAQRPTSNVQVRRRAASPVSGLRSPVLLLPDSVADDYRAGVSVTELRRRYKCQWAVLRATLEARGVEIRRAAKSEAIDLGLALLSIARIPGEPLTLEDIAAWCDCTRERIRQIERDALRKIRRRLSKEEWEQLAGIICNSSGRTHGVHRSASGHIGGIAA